MNAPDLTAEIMLRAAARGASKDLPYAGEVTPTEAWQLTQAGAKIIDVRYRFEHEYIGRIAGSILIEWKHWPSGKVNMNFVAELAQHATSDEVLLLLCRSGLRSHAAGCLASVSGYNRVFNILEGFEGDLDATGKRGRVGGWRHAGLDWVQD